MRSVFGWSAVALGILVSGNAASAQVIGTFRWQLGSHCNVLTLTVEQNAPGRFALNGFDDLCGPPAHRAPTVGLAELNGDGTISFAVTTTRPDAISVSTSALISLQTIGGPWSDAYGNSGTLLFNPTSPAAGEPRHVTLTGPVSVEFAAIANNQVGSASFAFGRTAPLNLTIATVVSGGVNANCPGTYASPKAAPGFLCVFQGPMGNVTGFDVSRYDNNGLTYGGRVTVVAMGIGATFMAASWAATIP